jgi:hypothetical protein
MESRFAAAPTAEFFNKIGDDLPVFGGSESAGMERNPDGGTPID